MSDDRAKTVDIPLRFTMAASTMPTVEQAHELLAQVCAALEAALHLGKSQGGFPELGVWVQTPKGHLLLAKAGAEIFVRNLRVLVDGVAKDKDAVPEVRSSIIIP